MPNIMWNTITTYRGVGEIIFPEDMESSDAEDLKKHFDGYMDSKYPSFEPAVISTFDKDYFMPALKVLMRNSEGRIFSPTKVTEWKDMELSAVCANDYPYDFRDPNPQNMGHAAPYEYCDCGIYGSVNLEEILQYRSKVMITSQALGLNTMNFINAYLGSGIQIPKIEMEEKKGILCIVEPAEDAKVIICRKGWKASKVFISEIIEETISIDSASDLLSIAWQRAIDIRRMYESR